MYTKNQARPITEEEVIETLDKYADEQGGSQLYIVLPGYLPEEVDAWCFDRTRKPGDSALFETEYGYTVYYISCIIER